MASKAREAPALRKGVTPRKGASRPRAKAAARLIEGRDFTREHHETVVTLTGFERMATAIMSGRAVYARVGANVVLRVLAK